MAVKLRGAGGRGDRHPRDHHARLRHPHARGLPRAAASCGARTPRPASPTSRSSAPSSRAHPEAQTAVQGTVGVEPLASFATARLLLARTPSSSSTRTASARPVRFRWLPEAGEERIPDDEAKARGRDYLYEDLAQRLANGGRSRSPCASSARRGRPARRPDRPLARRARARRGRPAGDHRHRRGPRARRPHRRLRPAAPPRRRGALRRPDPARPPPAPTRSPPTAAGAARLPGELPADHGQPPARRFGDRRRGRRCARPRSPRRLRRRQPRSGTAPYLRARLDGIAISFVAQLGRTSCTGVDVRRSRIAPDHDVVVFALGTPTTPRRPARSPPMLASAQAAPADRLVVATLRSPAAPRRPGHRPLPCRARVVAGVLYARARLLNCPAALDRRLGHADRRRPRRRRALRGARVPVRRRRRLRPAPRPLLTRAELPDAPAASRSSEPATCRRRPRRAGPPAPTRPGARPAPSPRVSAGFGRSRPTGRAIATARSG